MNTESKPTKQTQPRSKKLDASAIEARWRQYWDTHQIYRYDDTQPREQTFVIDTPPPTVSGSLHVGHVFSYTHTDILARYQRMQGKTVLYPMGWDDNGLPTERRVQQTFHIQCDPDIPYQGQLTLPQANAKRRKKPPTAVSRGDFIEQCERLTTQDEQTFEELFRAIGLSVDWSQTYRTIDKTSQHTAQASFLDLHAKGLIYQTDAPVMWDIDYQTAVALAEVEHRTTSSAFYELAFGLHNQKDTIPIATTRPELLPACVGVAIHPDDHRYHHLIGQTAITPLFRATVPILAAPEVEPDKGTGIVMICTFGDATDVIWWQQHKLPLRPLIGRDGTILPITFGETPWECLTPQQANEAMKELIGTPITIARKRIVELLREPAAGATSTQPPLQKEPQPTEQTNRYYEKGERPLETITSRQWFVSLTEHKERLLAQSQHIQWTPTWMKQRLDHWIEGLALDWCISRQRYFGVPFPLWYPLDKQGQPIHERAIIATKAELPVDPTMQPPRGYTEEQRGQPGGFIAETDVFDTWFTSSLTPQRTSHWLTNRQTPLLPMDLRPQSHEIIRTWAFYTLAKSVLHDDQLPWKHVVISGWILDPDRKKMSKSKGNAVTPMHLLASYPADALRYWAGSARPGADTAYDPNAFKVGKRLVTKLFHAGQFVLQQQGQEAPVTEPMDQAFLHELRLLLPVVTEAFEAFDYTTALRETERSFWGQFTDTTIEFLKTRARGDHHTPAAQGSAIATLRLGLRIYLRLFAPFLPFITEEIWSWFHDESTTYTSIHQSPWPTTKELEHIAIPGDPQTFQRASACFAALNKARTQAGQPKRIPIQHLELTAHPEALASITCVWDDIQAATHIQQTTHIPDPTLPPDAFHIKQQRFEKA